MPPAVPPRFSVARLFFSFLRLGLTAFGGPAMIAYIKELAVKKNSWLDEASFKQGVAVCQMIPGATAMQAAAYVGLRAAGPLGALAAYIGLGLPAFLLMVVLAAVYEQSRDLAAILALFTGLQVIVIALLANASFEFGRSTLKSRLDIALGLGVTAFLALGGNPILAILLAALLGLLICRPGAGQGAASPAPPASVRRGLAMPLLLLAGLLAGLGALYFLNPQLFRLAAVMARVDLFAFGGGYASVPLMFNEVVSIRHWLDEKTFLDGIALGQVTPGPIVITATFVGYLLAGLPGALVGTIAIFTPSLIFLTAAVPYADRLRNNVRVQRMMHGVLVSFVGLLLSVTIRFALAIPWDLPRLLLCITALTALRLRMDILWVVLVGGMLSVLLL